MGKFPEDFSGSGKKLKHLQSKKNFYVVKKNEEPFFIKNHFQSASLDDSGNYTCAPANALPDSLILNVIKGTNIF